MKACNENRCPCCSRHCPRNKICCKRGRCYFSNLERKETPAKNQKTHKWDRYTREGGLARKLLCLASRTKKRLRKSICTEDEIFEVLSADEQLMLSALLDKLQARLLKAKE